MLIDTHCHLDAAEFDADRDDVVDAAVAAGVDCIICLLYTSDAADERTRV
jgi:TatD DNase family protein